MKIKTLFEANRPFDAFVDATVNWIAQGLADLGVETRVFRSREGCAVLIVLETVQERYKTKHPKIKRAIAISMDVYKLPNIRWSYDVVIKGGRGHTSEDSGTVDMNQPTMLQEILSKVKKYQ